MVGPVEACWYWKWRHLLLQDRQRNSTTRYEGATRPEHTGTTSGLTFARNTQGLYDAVYDGDQSQNGQGVRARHASHETALRPHFTPMSYGRSGVYSFSSPEMV